MTLVRSPLCHSDVTPPVKLKLSLLVFSVTNEKLPMIYIYAGAGGGTFLIILIILLVIYCVLETAKKRRLKQVIAAMNKVVISLSIVN